MTDDDRPPPVTDDDLIVEYARLVRRNRDIDAEKKHNNQRLDIIKDRVLAIFEARQQRAVDLIGLGNLHLIKVRRAKVVRQDGNYTREATDSERERAKLALIAGGWEDLLKETFNLNSITGRVNEALKNGDQLPPEIKTGIHVETGWDLGLTVPNTTKQ